MKNWMLEPTGIPGVLPLDPTTIPKFVNQLTKPPVFVPWDAMRPETGKNLPPIRGHRKDDSASSFLPPGFPEDEGLCLRRPGELRRARPAAEHSDGILDRPDRPSRQSADQRIFVHYINNLDGAHMFPVDPTIMAANPNNAPIPTAPFKPFPPGYPQFQSPIPTVAHLHGGVTPLTRTAFRDPGSPRTNQEGPDIQRLHVRIFQRAVADDALVSRPRSGHDAPQSWPPAWRACSSSATRRTMPLHRCFPRDSSRFLSC